MRRGHVPTPPPPPQRIRLRELQARLPSSVQDQGPAGAEVSRWHRRGELGRGPGSWVQPRELGYRQEPQGSRRAKGLQGAAGAAAASAAPRGSPAPPRPRWRPSPSLARLRGSGRGPAVCALLGGGCCDGEAAALPDPCCLSHLRHLGLGPRRAGRSCLCPGPAL